MLILVLRKLVHSLEPCPLQKTLAVEKGMNRESDEREIFDLVCICADLSETSGAFAQPKAARDWDLVRTSNQEPLSCLLHVYSYES